MTPEEVRTHLARIAAARENVRHAGGTWPAKRELADALRGLLAEISATAASESELRALAATVREATHAFQAAGHAQLDLARRDGMYVGMENFHDRGPIVGLANPMAAPLDLRLDLEANVVRGRATYGAAHEGAPGLLHGGILAAAFDELLGYATSFSGHPGMTRELSVRYERPTPLHALLSFTGRLERSEGRKLFVSAECEANGVRTSTAHGVFIQVDGEKFAEFAKTKKAGTFA